MAAAEARLRDCREGARSVRAAEFGAAALGYLRPRTLGLTRTRAPASLQLYRAAREGRLIWHGPRSFAVLSLPADRVHGRGRALQRIDHHWPLVVVAVEFLAFVLVALVIVALRRVIGPTATWYALIILELVFLLAVLADQVAGLLAMVWRGLRGLVRGRPTAGQVAAETLPFEEWTMRLCHHEGDEGAALLLTAVSERLTTLAGPGAVLACPRDGITTSGMRVRVAAWADGLDIGENQEISVRVPRQLPVRWQRVVDTGSFFFLWLAALAVVLLGSASIVASWERGACAGECEGRPTTFATALQWLAYRLMWQEPPDLTAATFYARSTGLMLEILWLLTPVIAAFSLVRYLRYRRQLREECQQRMNDMFERPRVLLIVATPVEREAVLAQARTHRDTEPVPDFEAGHPVYRLGVIGGADVFLAQVGTGLTSPVSAAYSVPELLAEWRPHYAIMPGICYGLREEHQRLGDIIIAEQLQVISVRAGETTIRDRGDKVTAGHRLIERFKLATPPPGVRVWPGLLLSWDALIDNTQLRSALKSHYPEAQAGEMEGAALYAAIARTPTPTEWLVVKAISDWGHHKHKDNAKEEPKDRTKKKPRDESEDKTEHGTEDKTPTTSQHQQEQAATNSAKLVLDLIATRALTPPRPTTR